MWDLSTFPISTLDFQFLLLISSPSSQYQRYRGGGRKCQIYSPVVQINPMSRVSQVNNKSKVDTDAQTTF